jgi:hypothetical protein
MNKEKAMKTALNIVVCAAALLGLAAPARAEDAPAAVKKSTVTWETAERAVPANGTRLFRLESFDDNHDGMISRREVGAHMFLMFDTDGNHIVDNIEYERKAVLSLVPMEKTTKITFDLDGDGKPEDVRETGLNFMKETQLTRFNATGDGLSPHEFMQRGFLRADINRDHAIDEKEWQGSYDALTDKKNRDKALYNK